MLQSIQYLRAVAALMVVFHHTLLHLERHGSGVLPTSTGIGQAGVDIFFAISGFIMIYISSEKEITPVEFWRDRIIRIVPLYWYYTLLMISIAFFLPSVLHTGVFDISHALKSLFFIPSYHPNEQARIWPILVQGWTLNYEIFFYFVFGLMLFLRVSGARLIGLATIFLLLSTSRLYVQPENPILIVYTNTLLLEFLAGCMVGYCYVKNIFPTWLGGVSIFVLGLILFLYSAMAPGWGGVRAITWGIPGVFVLVGLLAIEKNVVLFQSKILQHMGDSSYSLYLVHTFVLGVVGFAWAKMPIEGLWVDSIFIVLGLVLSVVAGIVSYHLLEKPTIKKLKSLLNTRFEHTGGIFEK